MRNRIFLAAAAAIGAAITGGMIGSTAADTEEVNLYSYRQPFLINPLMAAFTKRTGIKVNIVYAQNGMLERIKAEGLNTPADAVLTVDIGRLHDMVQAKILQPVRSDYLERVVPSQYRDPTGLWFGLTTRARIVFASRDRVKPGTVRSYEDLASPVLKGRVCSRSAKHVYNISLIASVIAHKGEAGAEAWLRRVKNNLARKPQGNDRAQAKAIHEGLCDVALSNTYYMGLMATNDKKPEQKKWTESIYIVFPNQGGRGTHVNVSGAAVVKHAKNRDNAVKLIEFLASADAQGIYAEQNLEYPVTPGIPLHPMVATWGSFKADDVNLAAVAKFRAAASRLVDRVGYERGPGS